MARAPRPHVGHLLTQLTRAFEQTLIPRVRASGFDISVPHAAVFGMIDAHGTRVGVLADRAGVTRQAMSQLVDELERKGYLARTPDPADRRAKLVELTDLGWDCVRCGRRHIRGIEREYAKRLGRERFEQLAELLADLQPDA
jgi:DNA-binding MarR family transcriptional regulator